MRHREVPILRLPYTEEEMAYISSGIIDVLKSGYLTMGKKVTQFEQMFADFTGVKYAIATNSGTSSLEIILRSIGIEGKTVVVPSNTFIASPISVIHAGGRIIFADCQRENLQLDPQDLKRTIRADTVAVMLVHIGGIISPALNEIREICRSEGLRLIEDAAHAHGAAINNETAGTLGVAGSFSFFPTKVLTTAEGGIITTDDDRINESAITLRDHGKPDAETNVHTEIGYNWRFSELHAVLGLQQMMKIKSILAERRKIARMYDDKLAGVKGIRKLQIPANIMPSYYKYIVFLEDSFDRGVVKRELKEKYGVSLTGEVYSHPCHSQPVFAKYPQVVANDPSDTFPNTEYVAQRHICLPLYLGLNEEEIDYVVESLERVLS